MSFLAHSASSAILSLAKYYGVLYRLVIPAAQRTQAPVGLGTARRESSDHSCGLLTINLDARQKNSGMTAEQLVLTKFYRVFIYDCF